MENLFQCSVCGHIEFDGAPDSCPVCGAPKNKFTSNPDIMHNDGKGNEKHVPVIMTVDDCGLMGDCQDVNVKIGTVEHPMEEKHYIKWIDCYINNKYAARYELTPNVKPAVGIHLPKGVSGKVTVIEYCVVHGTWMSQAAL